MRKNSQKQAVVEEEVLTLPVNTLEQMAVQRSGNQGVWAMAGQITGADVGRADSLVCEQRGTTQGHVRLQLVVQAAPTPLE